jgi:folylpolyglutamate synthase/dihydropteroate synthase
MEGLVQSIVQRQLKNEEKRKKNEIIKEALKEARNKSSGGEKGNNTKRNKQRNGGTQSEQSKNSASPSQPPKHAKRKHSNDPDMRNGNIASRTRTGVKARHTRLRKTPTITLDGAHPKDVVEAAAEVAEAPTEVKGAGEVGPE